MDLLIDYLTFSVKNISLKHAIRLFGLQNVQFVEGSSKFRGYRYGLYSKGIQLFYGGDNGGVCISFSGTGCRALESYNPGLNWYRYIMLLYRHYPRCHISRLDVACDEREGILNYNKLKKDSLSRHYVSRFDVPLVSDGAEQSIIWGSPTSRIRVRIYNKALERGLSSDQHWMRCEMQLRDEAALSFIREWHLSSDLGKTYCGILVNQIRYTSKENTGDHTTRLKTARYWSKFTQGAERLKMAYPKGLSYNLEKVEQYIFGQAGISIALWLEANGGDLDKLAEMVSMQQYRYRPEHRTKLEILRAELLAKGEVAYKRDVSLGLIP